MSNILKLHGGKFLAAGGLITAAYLLLPPFSIRTPGVQNIEARYSSGGASKHHTPGAGTRRGSSDDVAPRGADQPNTGPGSEEWQEKIGGQKPDPGPFDRVWNRTHYGSEKGK